MIENKQIINSEKLQVSQLRIANLPVLTCDSLKPTFPQVGDHLSCYKNIIKCIFAQSHV